MGGPSISLKSTGANRIAVPVTASLLSLASLAYIWRYGSVVPRSDEWGLIPFIHLAHHGNVPYQLLWDQHFESRMWFPNLIFLASGLYDHFNLRAIMMLSGLLSILSYVLLLIALRSARQRPLTWLPVLMVGLIWFSLTNSGNILWAFQIEWFLAVACLLGMIVLLTTSRWPRAVIIGVSIVLAAVASLSCLQGFLLWPLGILMILWAAPRSRQAWRDAGIMLGGAFVTLAIYLPGYNVGGERALCPPGTDCSVGHSLSHPTHLLKYLTKLTGSIAPNDKVSTMMLELIGAFVILAALVAVVVTITDRRRAAVSPLPLVLIAYAGACDLAIALGRSAFTPATLPEYAMPQIMLVTGVMCAVLIHLRGEPTLRASTATERWTNAGWALLLVLVIFQTVPATVAGISAGQQNRATQDEIGRAVVNLDQIPVSAQACTIDRLIWSDRASPAWALGYTKVYAAQSKRDQLAMFAPGVVQQFEAEGPPSIPAGCAG